MERSSLDQAVNLITRSTTGVLLAVPAETSADAVAATVGLALALEQLGKSVTMVSPSFVPDALQFLPGTSQVHERLEPEPALRLAIPLGGVRPADVRWEVTDDTLRIVIEPSGDRHFPDADIRIERHRYPWDTIVTVGADRLRVLGPTFTEHATFFYDTAIINLDRGTTNEFFGAVNLVPATASTVSEVALELLETIGGVSLLTREVTTCLLAGVIAGSQSFRSPMTSPRTFQAASRLLEQDADHQTIVRHLFKTHTSAELRLLGHALAHLEELDGGALLTVIPARDVQTATISADIMPRLLGDVLEWTGSMRAVCLAFERTPGATEVLVAVGRMSTDDRDAFRDAVGGTAVGPFVLINLGDVPLATVRDAVQSRLLARLVPSTRGEES